MYHWVPSLFTWHCHNIANWLNPNIKGKAFGKNKPQGWREEWMKEWLPAAETKASSRARGKEGPAAFFCLFYYYYFKTTLDLLPKVTCARIDWSGDWHVLIDLIPQLIAHYWVSHCEWLQSRLTLIARSWVYSTKIPECFTAGIGEGLKYTYACIYVCVYIYIQCSFRWPLWQFSKNVTLKIFFIYWLCWVFIAAWGLFFIVAMSRATF